MRSADAQGFTTKVTALADGFGLRVFRHGKIVSEGHVKFKGEVGSALKEMLRMIDKCGNPSDMASASRDRQNRK